MRSDFRIALYSKSWYSSVMMELRHHLATSLSPFLVYKKCHPKNSKVYGGRDNGGMDDRMGSIIMNNGFSRSAVDFDSRFGEDSEKRLTRSPDGNVNFSSTDYHQAEALRG
ncbi:hypothetical protein V9T40_006946 [Parthenolecanium corni]|uniref:Uncharacterized protein n=1 Tax=Parthenolecanium corni TaxID=536013 RepID=A0AAN9Y9D9_9HEMI